MKPAVTIVVAAYNRPDTLRVALKSTLRQTLADWRLLVVGDHCDPELGEVVASFDDPRMSFVNLPVRFGEQGGPNSVGMALADTEFISLLNHDDVFLPDHLERALHGLGTADADFFVGGSATAFDVENADAERARPVFSRIAAPEPHGDQIFSLNGFCFEPASAWVFRTALARRVGPWRSSHRLYRLALHDWILRAWRHRAKFIFERTITVLKMNTHNRRSSARGCYGRQSPEHDYLGALVETLSPDAVRGIVEAELASRRAAISIGAIDYPQSPTRRAHYRLLINRFTRTAYYWTGLDAYSAYARLGGAKKGALQQRFSMHRTAHELPPPPDLVGVLAALGHMTGR